MSKVKESVKSEKTLQMQSSSVWGKLVAFGGTEKFVPDLIEKVDVEGSGIGAIRTIYIKGGGIISEKLTAIDEMNRVMKFIILSTPMPVHNYEGVFSVEDSGNDNCSVQFESIYEVTSDQREEMHNLIKNFQTTFISNLDK